MAALSPVVDSLDTVPEPARTFYEQKDGKYHLALSAPPPGFAPAADLNAANAKVVEFRDNNIALQKTLETLKPLEAFKDLGADAATAKAALAKVKELGDKGVTKAEDVTAIVARELSTHLKPLQDQLAQSQATIEAERRRADESTLRSAVSEKFLKANGQASALKFVVDLAREEFAVEGGEVKAKPNKFSAVKVGEPLNIDEWMTGVLKSHPFFFEQSRGGGAGNNGAPGASDGLKPGQTVLTDPTPQQLGQFADDIRAGKVVVRHTK